MTLTLSGIAADIAERSEAGYCIVMGVVNVTPDSFSDGGAWFEPDAAIAHGRQLLADGADIVDVGGESTRPGAGRVPVEEEQRRVLPVVRALAAMGAVVSIDTTRASTAAAAISAGAAMINDVSGGADDPDMPALVAESGRPYVVMHSRGPSLDMQNRTQYGDVVTEVVNELSDRIRCLLAASVDHDQLIVDPGLGFAKSAEHNWALLANLDAFDVLRRPVLVGASRKGFLGRLLADETNEPRPPAGRDTATAAISALVAAAGVWGVRVHEVSGTVDALRVAGAVRAARLSNPQSTP